MEAADGSIEAPAAFHDRFGELFDHHFPRLFRALDRLSGDPELAADLVQETFLRLYRRGSMPADPPAWLISVALNLLRNESTTRKRRALILTRHGAASLGESPPAPDQRVSDWDERNRVRRALDQLPEREQRLLLLRAEGYSYRELATVLRLNEASVGTLLARAREQFRSHYGGGTHAS